MITYFPFLFLTAKIYYVLSLLSCLAHDDNFIWLWRILVIFWGYQMLMIHRNNDYGSFLWQCCTCWYHWKFDVYCILLPCLGTLLYNGFQSLWAIWDLKTYLHWWNIISPYAILIFLRSLEIGKITCSPYAISIFLGLYLLKTSLLSKYGKLTLFFRMP